MSNFAHELEALKSEKHLSASDITARSGVDVATLSRVKAGERDITFEHLRLICRAFPDYAARLLRARLLDECGGPGGEKIRIELVDEKHLVMGERSVAPVYRTPLPPAVDGAMRVIIDNLGTDPKLRNVMLFIAERLKLTPSSAKIETHGGAILDGALSGDADAVGKRPAPSGPPAGPVHYGKARRKRSK